LVHKGGGRDNLPSSKRKKKKERGGVGRFVDRHKEGRALLEASRERKKLRGTPSFHAEEEKGRRGKREGSIAIEP